MAAECTRAAKKGRAYAAHTCSYGTFQIILEHARAAARREKRIKCRCTDVIGSILNKGEMQCTHTRLKNLR